MARIEFARLTLPGLVGIRLRGRTLAVETFGVKAWKAAQRIALGAPIDGGKFLSRMFQCPVRLNLVFVSDLARIPTTARASTIGSGAPSSSTVRSGCAWRARSILLGALINSLRAKTLVSSVGSCPASAVIETSTPRATHHGEATERAHPIRERPIREASARVLSSRARAAA